VVNVSDDLPVTQAWADAFTLGGFDAADQLQRMAASADEDPLRVAEVIIGLQTAAATATGVAIRKLEERIAALEAGRGLDRAT